jgi:hypothetical protein
MWLRWLLLLTVFSNSAIAADWQQLPFTRKGAISHFDRDSLRRTPEQVSVWVRFRFLEGGGAAGRPFGVSETRQRIEFQCSSRLMRWQEAAYFDADGEQLGEERPGYVEWREAVPDSFDESLLKGMCGEAIPTVEDRAAAPSQAPRSVEPCVGAVLQKLSSFVATNLRYPSVYDRARVNATMLISVTLFADRPGLASVQQSTGFVGLDEAGLAAAKTAVRDMRMPSNCANGTVTASVPFNFKLDR